MTCSIKKAAALLGRRGGKATAAKKAKRKPAKRKAATKRKTTNRPKQGRLF